VGGPLVTLLPAAGQSVAMALHELATNAVKHGSLASPSGRLDVRWHLGEEGLVLTWRENGGPRITSRPTRRGFGITVIEAGIRHQLDGAVTLDWLPDGLRATIVVPRTELAVPHAAAPSGSPQAETLVDGHASAPPLQGVRILVVEDEALIAEDLRETLETAGCVVVGPCPQVREAVAEALGGRIDGAILDRNLKNQSSEPVAEALRRRGVPFVVVSGYADTGLPEHFSDVPLLAKPFQRGELIRVLAQEIGRPVAERA
jgi:CheY-like chemotaxis protein